MLIVVETLLGVICLEAELLKHLYYTWLDRNFILPNNEPLVLAHWLVKLDPLMLLDL